MISIATQSVISDLQSKRPIDPYAFSADEWLEIAREIRSLQTLECVRWIAKIQVALRDADVIDEDAFIDRLNS